MSLDIIQKELDASLSKVGPGLLITRAKSLMNDATSSYLCEFGMDISVDQSSLPHFGISNEHHVAIVASFCQSMSHTAHLGL